MGWGLEIEIKPESGQDFVFKRRQISTINRTSLSIYQLVHHAVVARLHRLVELAGENHADDAQMHESFPVDGPVSHQHQVAVKDGGGYHERLHFVPLLFLEHDEALHADGAVVGAEEDPSINLSIGLFHVGGQLSIFQLVHVIPNLVCLLLVPHSEVAGMRVLWMSLPYLNMFGIDFAIKQMPLLHDIIVIGNGTCSYFQVVPSHHFLGVGPLSVILVNLIVLRVLLIFLHLL